MIKIKTRLKVSQGKKDSGGASLTYTVDGVNSGTYFFSGDFVTFSDSSNIFDRSNISNFSNDARQGFYDSLEPNKWHYTELNINTVTDWLTEEERIYFAPPLDMSNPQEINSISTFTVTQTGQDAEQEHAKIGHILLIDSNNETLFDSNNLPLWDN